MLNRFAFIGGTGGKWRVSASSTVRGDGLPTVAAIDVQLEPSSAAIASAPWVLYGVMSNVRYATRTEVAALKSRQEGLGRPAARCAALIPIRKSPQWWALAQDERRAILEEQSHHTAIGLEYLPAVARQLYHCRDLGEPFDFLTWFEYAPEHAAAFEELVQRLRASTEWLYVEREIDFRLERVD